MTRDDLTMLQRGVDALWLLRDGRVSDGRGYGTKEEALEVARERGVKRPTVAIDPPG